MRLYLFGPMRGYPQENHPAFYKAAAALRAQGHQVFNPAENGNAGDAVRQFIGGDLAWICSFAEGLVGLPGWEASKGSHAETATACAIGVPVWELGEFLAFGTAAVPLVLSEARWRMAHA